jgi:hypothetical protein
VESYVASDEGRRMESVRRFLGIVSLSLEYQIRIICLTTLRIIHTSLVGPLAGR